MNWLNDCAIDLTLVWYEFKPWWTNL